MKPEIQIIGTGGIRTGQDAFEHLLCGASMLQIGTELHKEGPEIFSRIIKELTQIMSEKDIRQLTNLKANYAPFHSKETKVMIDLRLFL